MTLGETVKFGREWWRNAGNTLVGRVKALTKQGIGAEGRFPPYSNKGTAWWKTYAENKAAGEFKRQASRQINPPDLTLTGDFLRDLKVTAARDTGCTVGWPSQGAKVEWNAASGRPVSTDDQPLAQAALDMFDHEFSAELDRRLALSATPVHITFKI